jgi:HK97 gp10 family phage protein
MANTINIEGLDAVLATMAALPASITKNALPFAMRKGAQVWVNDAKRRAPVLQADTKYRVKGKVRDLIALRKRKRKPSGIALVYSVGVLGGASATYGNTKANRRKGIVGQKFATGGNAYYWRFLEFGTQKMKARPFLRPAFDTTQDQVISAVVNGLNRAIKKAQKP